MARPPMDAGLLKASQSSDAKMLDCEFTVVDGPYARRKFWQNFTVAGGKLDDKGQSKGWNISKSAFRAMVDSALGLDPKDESPAAKQKRVIQGLKQLDGIVFAARIMVEPASSPQYKDAEQARERGAAGRAAIRRRHARRDCAAGARERQAAQRPRTRRPRQSPAWATQPSAPAAPPASAACPGPARMRPKPAERNAAATGPAWLNG